MSSRLARTLLKLYPRRIRDRYSEELLALEDELTEHGEVSRMGLIGDMLAGALAFWPSSQRARLVAGLVCVLVGVTVAAVITGGFGIRVSAHGPRAAARATAQAAISHKRRHAPTVTAVNPPYTTCYVSAGSPCVSTPCTQFTSAALPTRAVAGDRAPAAHRATPPPSASPRHTDTPLPFPRT